MTDQTLQLFKKKLIEELQGNDDNIESYDIPIKVGGKF